MQLGIIIPLAAKPDQCHDAITPNDMYSDRTCAFSGAFLLFGGFAAIMWGKKRLDWLDIEDAYLLQASSVHCLYTYRYAGKSYLDRSSFGHPSWQDGAYRLHSLLSLYH